MTGTWTRWSIFARAAALAALASACTPDFQSPRDVTDLRVLAIKQEALEQDGTSIFADAFVDFGQQQAQRVRITALVADLQPRRALAASGQVCSPTDSGRCDEGPALPVARSGAAVNAPALAVEQQPVFDLTIPPEALAAAQQADDLKGFGGIRVQFAMQVDDGDPLGPVQASKILLYTTGPDSTRNHNPEIASLEITQDGAHVASVGNGDTLSLTAGVEYGVRPLLGSGGAGIEEYDTIDLSGKTVHLREEPRYSFFATPPASFDRDTADEPLPDQPQPTNGLARLTLSGPGAILWVVVRDGRGGVGWISVSCAVAQ
ncbi:MAG TPA: hypothetical protein VG496_07045 [Myxococcales bacterium]|nr:hypothetical protein [Myxococcales bacterium]